MNLNHLTDDELIDHVIKYDDDPVRVRLATHMQRVAGAIIDDLVHAGMDETWCEFRSVVTSGMYHPGAYIRHLEDEIDYLNMQAMQTQKELDELKARTVMDLIVELKNQIKTAEWCAQEARREQEKAQENEKLMKDKLNMWTTLNS